MVCRARQGGQGCPELAIVRRDGTSLLLAAQVNMEWISSDQKGLVLALSHDQEDSLSFMSTELPPSYATQNKFFLKLSNSAPCDLNI